tara:strand:+ start:178 stop:567 length:390 start_codon:yes stop_codon:yes gene_type:complete
MELNKKIKICPTCKMTHFTSTKTQTTGGRSNYQVHYCVACCDTVEPVWACAKTYPQPVVEHPFHVAEQLREEVVRLTKENTRLKAAQAARDAAMAASLPEAIEQAQQAKNDADTIAFYGSIGRDEWPTR